MASETMKHMSSWSYDTASGDSSSPTDSDSKTTRRRAEGANHPDIEGVSAFGACFSLGAG